MNASLCVVEALATLAASQDPEIQAHCRQLVRTSGSYVEGMDTIGKVHIYLSALPWEEVEHSALHPRSTVEIVRYFKASIPEELRDHQAVKNVVNVSQALEMGLELELQVNKPSNDPKDPNPEGLGIYAVGTATMPTDEVWIGLGPFKGLIVPWFWHPGALGVPVRKSDYEALKAGRWSEVPYLTVHLTEPETGW